MLAAGVLYPGKQATTATALIVFGAGMLTMGILFPHIRELEIGPGGFKTKIVEGRDRLLPVVEIKTDDLDRFAYLVSGDQAHARELVEQALARHKRRHGKRATVVRDVFTIRTLIALLDTASERRWLSGKVETGAAALDSLSPVGSAEVVKALQELSFHQRVAFLLHADWSLRSDEVAQIIERPLETVNDDVRKAREMLRPYMNGQTDDAS